MDRIRHLAAERAYTPSQLALAWVMAQGNDIVPIPGTKRRYYLEENAAAGRLHLSAEDLRQIDEVAPHGAAVGTRYPQTAMRLVNG